MEPGAHSPGTVVLLTKPFVAVKTVLWTKSYAIMLASLEQRQNIFNNFNKPET